MLRALFRSHGHVVTKKLQPCLVKDTKRFSYDLVRKIVGMTPTKRCEISTIFKSIFIDSWYKYK